jgi:hypothetical protein
MKIQVNVEKLESIDKGSDEKVEVFEKYQRTYTLQQTNQQQNLSFPNTFGFWYLYPQVIIEHGNTNKQQQEPPIPPGIKKVTPGKQEQVLCLKVSLKNKPV